MSWNVFFNNPHIAAIRNRWKKLNWDLLTLQRKFELCIPRKELEIGIGDWDWGPNFHIHVYLWAIYILYSQDWSTHFLAAKYCRQADRGSILKGQCHEIFASGFFHESVSPKPLSIPLGPFRIFSKIRGDIRSLRLTTGINDTGGKFAAGINNTGGKFCHQFH